MCTSRYNRGTKIEKIRLNQRKVKERRNSKSLTNIIFQDTKKPPQKGGVVPLNGQISNQFLSDLATICDFKRHRGDK